MKLNKKASFAVYLVFIITAIMIITVTAVLAPMGVLFNTKMYAAAEDIYFRANDSIADINNATVRDSLYNVMGGGFAAMENNIEVNNALFQYGWIFILILTFLTLFILARRIVEVQGGGFV